MANVHISSIPDVLQTSDFQFPFTIFCLITHNKAAVEFSNDNETVSYTPEHVREKLHGL